MTTAPLKKLAIVQNKISATINKGAYNDFDKFKYVELPSMLALIKPIMQEEKLAIVFSNTDEKMVIQPNLKGGMNQVAYKLSAEVVCEETGERAKVGEYWTGGENKDIAKAIGSAATYGRKYALQNIFNLAADDDPDANGTPKQVAPNKPASNGMVSEKQINFIKSLATRTGTEMSVILTNFKVAKLEDLTAEYASRAIELLQNKEGGK